LEGILIENDLAMMKLLKSKQKGLFIGVRHGVSKEVEDGHRPFSKRGRLVLRTKA
jgi:hypothetical protein